MKFLSVLFLCGIFCSTAVWSDEINPAPKQVVLDIEDAYVPLGFDATSDVSVVISGVLPSSCYNITSAEVRHAGTFVHEVRLIANIRAGSCVVWLAPYTQQIVLGKFATGTHTIRLISGNGSVVSRTIEIGD